MLPGDGSLVEQTVQVINDPHPFLQNNHVFDRPVRIYNWRYLAEHNMFGSPVGAAAGSSQGDCKQKSGLAEEEKGGLKKKRERNIAGPGWIPDLWLPLWAC